MANWADIKVVKEQGRTAIVAVTTTRPDGDVGYYTVHDETGQIVRWGQSKGWDGLGGGSALAAMKNGCRSARRWLQSEIREGRTEPAS